MLNSIASIFSSSPQSQPAQQAPNPDQAQQPGMEPSTSADPKPPDNTTEPDNKSPLDQFQDLFDTTTDDKDPNKTAQDPNVFYALDPQKLQEAARRQDFTQVENFEELAQSAIQGDVNSLKTLLNSVTQNAFISAAQLSGDIANRTTSKGLERTNSSLPDQFKSFLSQDSLTQTNEAFKHPAMQPMVNAVRQQVQQKYPEASTKEITEMTNQYLTAVSSVFKGEENDPTQRPNPHQAQSSEGTDFSDFFR